MVEPLGLVENFFKSNRILLSLIGLWPNQTPGESRLATNIFLFLIISQLIPQFAGFFKFKDDFDTVIECLSSFGITGLCAIKLINLMTNNDKMKDLLTGMQKDFVGAISGPEIMIFQRYGKKSLKLSKIYAIYIYTAGTLYIVSPLLGAVSSSTLSDEMTKTESSKRLPFVVEYFVDTDKYFYLIIIHGYLSTIAFNTVLVSVDAIFTVYVQHGCAKFMILKYRLSQLTKPGELNADIYCPELDDLMYKKAKFCVHLHKEAMEFADAIESAFSTAQLFQVSLCYLLISIVGLHAVTKLNKPDELVRFFGLIFALMLRLFFYSWSSHELMDHSVNVCEAAPHFSSIIRCQNDDPIETSVWEIFKTIIMSVNIDQSIPLILNAPYNTEWYRLSIRTRKLLLQMMTRSIKECKITAGGLYLMSMENFCKILSNSMSYMLHALISPGKIDHNRHGIIRIISYINSPGYSKIFNFQ